MPKIKAIALTGPTASGKTALSVRLAEALGAEIISLDSMQIYRGMDIGTAKASESERGSVRHHMLDIIEPCESFSAQDYKRLATECARDIVARGRLPLFVGGTGLYLDTLTRNMSDEVPEACEEYRKSLPYDPESEEGREALHARLAEIDPESARKIHKNNVRRVIRALEIYDKTGRTKSYFDALSRKSSDFDIVYLTLDFHKRELLYARVDERVDEMMRAGLLDEVKALYESGALVSGTTAASAIGYKELYPATRDGALLDGCVEELKSATRAYAKRQLTWFRHNEDAYVLKVDTPSGELRPADELFCEAMAYIAKKL